MRAVPVAQRDRPGGSVDALLGALCLLHCDGPLHGTRLSSLSSSGGEAALIADAAVGRAVRFAELTSGAARRSCARCWATGWRWRTRSTTTPTSGVIPRRWPRLHGHDARPGGPPPALRRPAAGRPLRRRRLDGRDRPRSRGACAATGARGALVAAMAVNLTGERAAAWVRLRAGGARPARRRDGGDRGGGLHRSGVGGAARPPVAGLRGRCDGRGATTVLDEATGKRLLRQHGVPVPDGAVCTSPDAAIVAAADLAGPIAVKALGAAHKTDQRAVRLGLVDPADVRAAAVDLLARFPAVLVERLVSGAIAELLVGVQTDPVFGPMLSLGVGGVLTELVRDIAHLLLPVDATEIRRAVLGLRCAPLLVGYRGCAVRRPRRPGHRRRAGGGARAWHTGAGRAGDQPVDRHRWGRLGLRRAGRDLRRGSMSEQAVRTRRLGAVLEVTLDRPPANAIDLATSRVMGRRVRRVPRRPRAAGGRAAHRRASGSSARGGTSRRPPRATPWTATTAWAASAASRSCRA